MMEAVQAFFANDRYPWNITTFKDRPLLRAEYTATDVRLICLVQVRERENQVFFYSIAPIQTPASRRSEMSEFLTRANYGLLIGNFEMDFHDGEVRFKTSVDVEGDQLSVSLMRNLVYANILSMDRYISGVLAVAFGGRSAVDAMREIEGSLSDDVAEDPFGDEPTTEAG